MRLVAILHLFIHFIHFDDFESFSAQKYLFKKKGPAAPPPPRILMIAP